MEIILKTPAEILAELDSDAEIMLDGVERAIVKTLNEQFRGDKVQVSVYAPLDFVRKNSERLDMWLKEKGWCITSIGSLRGIADHKGGSITVSPVRIEYQGKSK